MFSHRGSAEIQTLILPAPTALCGYSGDLGAEGSGEVEDTVAMSGE